MARRLPCLVAEVLRGREVEPSRAAWARRPDEGLARSLGPEARPNNHLRPGWALGSSGRPYAARVWRPAAPGVSRVGLILESADKRAVAAWWRLPTEPSRLRVVRLPCRYM